MPSKRHGAFLGFPVNSTCLFRFSRIVSGNSPQQWALSERQHVELDFFVKGASIETDHDDGLYLSRMQQHMFTLCRTLNIEQRDGCKYRSQVDKAGGFIADIVLIACIRMFHQCRRQPFTLVGLTTSWSDMLSQHSVISHFCNLPKCDHSHRDSPQEQYHREQQKWKHPADIRHNLGVRIMGDRKWG